MPKSKGRVTKSELAAGREKFEAALQRQERIDAWAGLALVGQLAHSGHSLVFGPTYNVTQCFDAAEALEAERARRLGEGR